jgi:hypothetical protein
MSTPTAPRLAHEGFGRVTVSDEWVAYATRYGSGMVMKTAKQDGLGPEDLDRLAFALRELDPKFKPPRRNKPGPRPRHKIPAERRGDRACEHCGRALSGRSDRRTCSVACRVALKRERDRQAAGPMNERRSR